MIHVVTPCLNAVETIERTILSVISQAGDFELNYHIQDGGSTDGSLELITRWKSRIDLGLFPIQCRGLRFSVSSAPDTGMYDAIASGLEGLEVDADEFMAWINADDILMPGTLALINKVSGELDRGTASWIGGLVNVIRDDISVTQFPRVTPSEVIAAGLCDGDHWDFVQQEGIFFRKWLWDKVKAPRMLRSFKYAGDWNLWRLFAKYADYIHAPVTLGGFRVMENQLSRINFESYLAEIESVVDAAERTRLLKSIGRDGSLTQNVLLIQYEDADLSVARKDCRESVEFYLERKLK